MGRADLRLICHVLEDPELTEAVLAHDEYNVQARTLTAKIGKETGSTTADNISMTIHSRIAQMKILAALQDRAAQTNKLFSLRDFIEKPKTGVLVISKDAKFKSVQDSVNGVLFLRLTEILEGLQQKKGRKVFIIIDEFPTLAGDLPCPGITDMFLRLRSVGVSVLITYQTLMSLKRVYGETFTENLGQCTNVMYLRQSDEESAKYAEGDLGYVRGYERKVVQSQQNPSTRDNETSHGASVSQEYFDRPIHSATDLLNGLPVASPERGIHGIAKSAVFGPSPWPFGYPPDFIDAIPKKHPDIPEYEEWLPGAQRLRKLTVEEKAQLLKKKPRGDSWSD